MKRSIAAFFCVVAGLWASAGWTSTQTWTWAQQADTSAASSTATATAVAADAAGNTYVTGTYSGAVRIGAYALASSQGYTDMFLAKYDSAGTVLWAVAAGGMSCNPGALATDGNEVFITGYCFYGANFNGHPLTSGTTLFLVAADAGTGQFARTLTNGGTGYMYGYALALDPDGNLLLGGTFTKTVSVLGATLTATGGDNGGSEAFVIKLDKAFGQLAWARSGGGEYNDNVYAVGADANGNVFIAGDIFPYGGSGTATFGSFALTVPSYGMGDPFIAKLDRDGQWLWARSILGRNNDEARALSVDSAGNVYVAGRYATYAEFGSLFLASEKTGYAAFIAKLDGSGNFLWAQQVNNPATATIGGHAAAYGLVVRSSGNPVMGGYYGGETSFGSFALTSLNKADVFVAELDAATGGYLWVKSGGGGSGNDFGYGLAQTASGKFVAVGSYEDSAYFDSTLLMTGRELDWWDVGMFVATLNPAATPAATTLDGTIAASGTLTAQTLILAGMSVPSADLAGGVSLYVAAYVGGNFFFLTPGGWTTQMQAYSSGVTSVPSSIMVADGMNLSGLVGTTLWFGYGRGTGESALNDMLQGTRYLQVYTIQ
jgi:hypothetical protein